jgi:hypothetical protein
MGGGINASIPLMGQQPQFADPISQYEKAMQIKSIIGQQALQAQQQRANEIGIQQAQQSQADQQAMTTAMNQWDGNDYTQLPSLILKNGGSANAVYTAVQHLQDMKQKASEIAKNDAATNASNVETTIKNQDQYRGRLQAIINAPDDQKNALWDAEITKEEQAKTIQPGTISHQYPGDDAATVFANHYALGSQLVKEADQKQQTANASWKPLNGQLVNTQTGEKIGANLNVPQLNQALQARYQVLHPGQPLPPQFALAPNATPEDFSRTDKLMEAEEKAAATKAQQEQTNAIRTQTFELARDKQDLNAVVGTDPKTGRPVLVPYSQAQQMGIQNPIKADADMVNKSMAARHWLQLANGQGDPQGDPSELGIMQLVDKLDSEGKLGPLAGRWNDFMAGKFGAGDPEYAALRAKMGLSTTLLMQAHVGSRGGSALLEHFEDLANAGKMDGPTLKSAMGSEINYVQDKAMDPSATNYRKASAPSGPPAGATMKVPGSDGKLHWSDGKRDLGIVQ